MTTTTVKARRVNNNPTAMGVHQTLGNVCNEPTRCFGFAVTDAGEEVYLPSSLVKQHNMSPDDIGAGYTCPIRANPRAVDDTTAAPWIAATPLNWDGEAEDVIIEKRDNAPTPAEAELVRDFNALAASGGILLDNTLGPLDDIIDKMDKMMQGFALLFGALKQQRESLNKYKRDLDMVAPENDK